MKAFRADWVCPVSSPPVSNGVVLCEASRIVDITTRVPQGVSVEDFDGCAILPGFVNAHIHLELTVFRGYLEGLSFFAWIRRLTRAKYDQLSRADLAVSARLGALECLGAGVTTIGEVTDAGAGWEAMVESGLRGVAYQEVFGPAEEQADQAERSLRVRIAALRTQEKRTRRVGVSPHAPYTVSKGLYQRVRDFAANEGLPVAVHLAESEAEGDFVRHGTGPFAEYWKSRDIAVAPLGRSPVSYLDKLGLLSEGMLAIHAIDCDLDDIGRLRDKGVGVAHCPKSNLKLGHGIAPVSEFIDMGIPVGLGTDSVASNNAVDMFEEMRIAAFLQRTRLGESTALTAPMVLRMATLGGAECLGMDREVGSLESGKLADMVIVDLGDLALRPIYDPVDALVYSANRKNVLATLLGGERAPTPPHTLTLEAQQIAQRLRRDA